MNLLDLMFLRTQLVVFIILMLVAWFVPSVIISLTLSGFSGWQIGRCLNRLLFQNVLDEMYFKIEA